MSKYAMAVVIDDQTDNTPSEADTYVWEEVVAALNPGNGFLAKGVTCAFVGGPVAIHDREEYDTEIVAPYLAGTEKVAPPYEPGPWEQGMAEIAMGFGWLIEWDGGYATVTTHTTAMAVAGTMAEAQVRVSPNVPVPEAGGMSTSDGLGADAEVDTRSPGRITADEMADEHGDNHPGNDFTDALEERMVEAIDELQRVRAALGDVRGTVPSIAAVAMKDHGVEEF